MLPTDADIRLLTREVLPLPLLYRCSLVSVVQSDDRIAAAYARLGIDLDGESVISPPSESGHRRRACSDVEDGTPGVRRNDGRVVMFQAWSDVSPMASDHSESDYSSVEALIVR